MLRRRFAVFAPTRALPKRAILGALRSSHFVLPCVVVALWRHGLAHVTLPSVVLAPWRHDLAQAEYGLVMCVGCWGGKEGEGHALGAADHQQKKTPSPSLAAISTNISTSINANHFISLSHLGLRFRNAARDCSLRPARGRTSAVPARQSPQK